MKGQITYSYQSDDWNQNRFLDLGGFTVVFLNYNKAAFIERSVRSALDQDYPLLEMFFMDYASSDGSGDAMEAIVRQYQGRHKVSVVRNDENQYITGQWNIVSKLATGNWLGMFCGDDVAHSDRVSLVAERIRKYPTLRGIATAAVDVDPKTGRVLPDSKFVRHTYLICAQEKNLTRYRCNGSTSFWHKSLFVDTLPCVPLDDAYLHFRLFILNRASPDPVYMYDTSIKTIDYRVGVGVCAQGVEKIDGAKSPTARWVMVTLWYKNFLKKSVKTLAATIEYAAEKKTDANLIAEFKTMYWTHRIMSSTTVGRLCFLPELLIDFACGRVCGDRWFSVVRLYLRYLAVEFWGLWFASQVRNVCNIVRKTVG